MYSQQNYQVPIAAPIVRAKYQTVNDFIPNFIPGLLGAGQLVLWIAIVALEIVSVYYDAGRGTIYAGFWCSMVFFVTWIAMFCYLCCNKSSGCGIYLIIQNILSLIFAIILVIFAARFVQNPCLCYSALCYVPNWDFIDDPSLISNYYVYPCTTRTYKKLPVLKALLACAVLMLISHLIFIIVYIIASIRFHKKQKSNPQQFNVGYQQQTATVQMGQQPIYHPSPMPYSPYAQQQSYPIQYEPTVSAPPGYPVQSNKF
ncbi:hypothetical protein I4U23_010305 [Adineta vaga]|nr:hypothetical protein I4U23_010305 [Adineta vaga]